MSNVNITVLKDEALGGIEREYTEVKRKARVGERIKIVGNGYEGWGYVKGSVLTASGSVGTSGAVDYIQAEGIRVGIGDYEYVVLETIKTAHQPQPTDSAESDGYASEDTALIDASLLVLQREINDLKTQVDGLTGTVAKIATELHRQGTQLKAAREAFEVIAG